LHHYSNNGAFCTFLVFCGDRTLKARLTGLSMTSVPSIDAYVRKHMPATLPPNRAVSPILPGGLSDEEVVIRWLKTKASGDGHLSATTLSQYVVEARRLFWYARWIERPISAWTLDEAGDYLAFLRQPAAAALCMRDEEGKEIRLPRNDPRWTPFRCALTATSARQTQVIAGSLFKWLVDVGHLKANPFSGFGLAGKRRRQRGAKQARFVDYDGLQLARVAVAGRKCATERERAKQARDLFVLDLFTKVGLRTSEAIGASMGAIRYARFSSAERARVPDCPEGVWVIDVEEGKGGVRRTVSFASALGTLQEYRASYGLPPLPALGERTPLILGARRRTPGIAAGTSERRERSLRLDLGEREGIRSRSSVYRLVKGIFKEALDWWDGKDAVEAEKLTRASTHWLRHSFAKRLAEAGSGLTNLSRNLGHDDVNTSLVYVDDEENRRALETERLVQR
jgi:integrase/recombinase XerD